LLIVFHRNILYDEYVYKCQNKGSIGGNMNKHEEKKVIPESDDPTDRRKLPDRRSGVADRRINPDRRSGVANRRINPDRRSQSQKE